MNPFEFLDEFFIPKTRVLGLSFDEDFVILACVVFTQYQRVTEGQTDIPTMASTGLAATLTPCNSWARPGGAQLTAGYTINTYSIIHSALAPLAWRAYARGLYSRRCRASPARRPCVARHTFSGLAALCRMPKTKLIGRPVPEIWPNVQRTDRQTRLTNQPTGHPDSQSAVLPVPSCKLGTRWCVRAGPQLTAVYTVNTYSKPPLYYTLGAVAPLLPCLRTATVLCPATRPEPLQR